MKLEKFNLQDALNGRPVVTRDGNPVKIAGYNTDAEEASKLCGWSCGIVLSWTENGNYYVDEDSPDDLFHPVEEKQPRTFWVNEYSYGIGFSTFTTQEGARTIGQMSQRYITTHKITIP